MFYVVAYDITNDKRRKKISECLDKYGRRVNYSVYEIELNKTKLNQLLTEIKVKKLINKKYDSLRFYHLCKDCVPKSFELCNISDPFENEELFV